MGMRRRWKLGAKIVWLTTLVLTNLLVDLLRAREILHLIHLMHVHSSLKGVVLIEDEVRVVVRVKVGNPFL